MQRSYNDGYGGYGYGRNDMGAAIGSGILMITIVAMVILVYLLVKAADLVIRTFAKHPKHKGLWIALAIPVGSFALAGLAAALGSGAGGGSSPGNVIAAGFAVIGGIGLLGLVITARVVEVRHQDLFAQEKAPLVNNVLRKPWFGGWNEVEGAAA